MARFHGKVGYATPTETPANSGVWVDVITEAPYYGDVVRNSRNWQLEETLNGEVVVQNSISIVADEYAIKHFFNIRYVEWRGALWTVTSVEVQSPRLLLRLGSVYNGPTFSPPPDPEDDPGGD